MFSVLLEKCCFSVFMVLLLRWCFVLNTPTSNVMDLSRVTKKCVWFLGEQESSLKRSTNKTIAHVRTQQTNGPQLQSIYIYIFLYYCVFNLLDFIDSGLLIEFLLYFWRYKCCIAYFIYLFSYLCFVRSSQIDTVVKSCWVVLKMFHNSFRF